MLLDLYKTIFGYLELVSGSQNMLILLDAETSLPWRDAETSSTWPFRVQHDILSWYDSCDTVSFGKRGAGGVQFLRWWLHLLI